MEYTADELNATNRRERIAPPPNILPIILLETDTKSNVFS